MTSLHQPAALTSACWRGPRTRARATANFLETKAADGLSGAGPPRQSQQEGQQQPAVAGQVYVRKRFVEYFFTTTTLTCPSTHRYRLSCGVMTTFRRWSYNRRLTAYPYGWNSCRCYGVRGCCTALCTNKPTSITVKTLTIRSGGRLSVHCPTGYKVCFYSYTDVLRLVLVSFSDNIINKRCTLTGKLWKRKAVTISFSDMQICGGLAINRC